MTADRRKWKPACWLCDQPSDFLVVAPHGLLAYCYACAHRTIAEVEGGEPEDWEGEVLALTQILLRERDKTEP